MGKRRSLIRKIKHDEASKMNMIKTCENRGVELWSDLNHDVLLLVMMQLGVVDFLAFGGVCKSWRTLSLCNRNKFMASRTPMAMSISFTRDANEEECCLEDFEGRKFKTTLPHSAEIRSCIGVTCGYLIFLGGKTNDFWLVNPITRHELYFPDYPVTHFCCPTHAKGILVFSPSISGWVLVVVNFCSNSSIRFSIAGKGEWTKVSTSFPIEDLHAFKGKIYTLHSNVSLSELRLYPKPKLVLLETGSFQGSDFRLPGFVNSRENLYVMDRVLDHQHTNLYELEFGKLKWMSREKTGDKYAFFSDEFCRDSSLYQNVESSVDLCSQYRRYLLTDENGKGGRFHAKLWYFIHDCLNVNNFEE